MKTMHRRRSPGVGFSALCLAGLLALSGCSFGADATITTTDDNNISQRIEISGAANHFDFGDAHNELQAVIHYPKRKGTSALPVAFIQHGEHNPCFQPNDEWPCQHASFRIPSYQGYDYLGRALAAHGWVAVSISAQGTLGSADVSHQADLLEYYIELLTGANQRRTGMLGDLLVGDLDLSRIALIGHSRGADALLTAAREDRLRSRVLAIVMLAPALPVDDPEGRSIEPIPTPSLTVRGTCDGDTGDAADIYAERVTSALREHVVLSGANHNYFNSIWTTDSGYPAATDDAQAILKARPECEAGAPSRLSAEQQRKTTVQTVTEFLEHLPSPSTSAR